MSPTVTDSTYLSYAVPVEGKETYLSFHLLQGKMDAAISMIQKAIAANPSNAEAHNNLGLSPCLFLCSTDED